ncbi:MAG: hypothetical protein Q9162_004707 [Coniocarpon cinnabarinum]
MLFPLFWRRSFKKKTRREQRHEAARVLSKDAAIPSFIWMEDAVAQYDVPTVIFDVWLLVPNVEKAAQVLQRAGWTRTEVLPPKQRMKKLIADCQAFVSPSVHFFDNAPDRRHDLTILLPVEQWGLTLPDTPPKEAVPYVPHLYEILNSMMAMYISLDPDGHEGNDAFRDHIGVLIGYCYMYSEQTRDLELDQQWLDRKFLQLHYDLLENKHWVDLGARPSWHHHKENVEKIERGELQPQRPLEIAQMYRDRA